MSIGYSVSEDGLRIDTTPKGILDIDSTIDYFNNIQKDNSIKNNALEFVHFTYVTDFQISYLEIKSIAKSYKAPKNIKNIKATIFVCESNLAYGMGRMLQTFHDIINPGHKVMVIKSEKEVDMESIK